LIILVFSFLIYEVAKIYWDIDYTLYVVFMLGIISQLIFVYVTSANRGLEEFKRNVNLELLHKLSFVIIGVVVSTLWGHVVYVLFGYIFATLIISIYECFRLRPLFFYDLKDWSLRQSISFFKAELFPFSRWIFIQNLTGFFYVSVDKFLVAGLIGLRELAVYNIALSLSKIFPSAFFKGGSYLLSYFSKQKGKELDIQNVFNTINLKISVGLGLMMLLIFLIAPYLIDVYLYKQIEVAQSVKIIFPLLLVCGMFDSFHVFNLNFLNALKKVKYITIIKLIGDVFVVLAIVILGKLYGLNGILTGKLFIVLSTYFTYSILYFWLFKTFGWLTLFRILAPLFIASGIIFLMTIV
jgi:O-antigen/teichoic acid export membrane protein